MPVLGRVTSGIICRSSVVLAVEADLVVDLTVDDEALEVVVTVDDVPITFDVEDCLP